MQALVRTGLCLVVVVLSVVGCRDFAYDAASKKDTIDGYREFIRTHPDDQANLDSAKERLAELEFAEADKAHSVVGYKRFLEEFPDSGKVTAARARLEALRFNIAMERGTTAAWRSFVRDHPDGAHRAEADAALEKLELKELATLDDPQALKGLVERHADEPQAEAASARLDELAWSRVQTTAQTLAYLKDFPAGQHRDDARARLTLRELEALLVADDLAGARALAAKSPLQKALGPLQPRFDRAVAFDRLKASKDERVQRALPDHMLRPFDEVVRSLAAPDALDRWQAAEELGYHVTTRSIGPLIDAMRTARLGIVRQRAFEALGRVLRALPRDVAEFEVATRIDALRGQAIDGPLLLSIASLLDLSGQLERAAAEYQHAWDPNAPDPVVLRRWSTIRLERRQFFSAAVAARQLGLHGAATAAGVGELSNVTIVPAARELCSAAEEVRYALGVLDQVAAQKTEFPDDVAAFQLKAREQVKLVEARLRDAEVALLTFDPHARRCGDQQVEERMAEGEARRIEALTALKVASFKELPTLLEYLRERDPSQKVRAAASGQ
jgi:hypothetical protein